MRPRQIQKILNAYFPEPKVPLHFKDPYTLLIAALLSAQCTDTRVNQVTPLLFAKARTAKAMVRLSISQIEEIIHICGLAPTKAKAIWNLSQMLLDHYGGKVPASFEALEELPGVGHKTASVVMSQGFGIPAFPVDTHIFRCAKRWGLSAGRTVEACERDLKALFPKKDWNRLHLQIIAFARLYCPARGHKVSECPICSLISDERP